MSDEDFRYGKSDLTGNWYKITEWQKVDEPEGNKQKIIAKEKEEIDKSEVPDHVIEEFEE